VRIPATLASFVSALGMSCAYLRTVPVPMRVIELRAPAPAGRTLVVLLPGRWDRPETFVEEGFGGLLGAHLPHAAVLAPDAHVGYYVRGTVVKRLREDLVGPFRARGPTDLDFVGVSMGGLGAMLYASENPGSVHTIVALAPYLGRPAVIEEIAAAGGLAQWSPPHPMKNNDYERRLWAWLRGYALRDPEMPRLILAWGADDHLAKACRLLAAELPPSQVFYGPGGHESKTWKALLERILDAGLLSERATPR
jgi:pimeloyl-ACP methyl ester carboxylesterase